jgi:hypothetical protein
MAKSPDQRHASCGDFADALREALGLAPYRPGGAGQAPAPAPAGSGGPGRPGPVGDDPAGPAMTARRRRPRRAVRIGVPVALVAVIAIVGAVLALTRKPAQVLADRGNQAALTGAALSGYPGQRGAVTVSSIASDGGTQQAAGSADGQPAIWRRGAGGGWTLASPASSAVYQRSGAGSLTSVAHGPAGWIAVGGAVSGAARQPIVVTSADGVTWHALDRLAAFAGPAGYVTYVTAVTAGPDGYVIAGKEASATRTIAAMWWSADLRTWVPGSNGHLDGRLKPSTVYAAAATPAGFVAVGTHGSGEIIWTSADGRNWIKHDMAVPSGASAGKLSLVTVNGSRAVAAHRPVRRGRHGDRRRAAGRRSLHHHPARAMTRSAAAAPRWGCGRDGGSATWGQ